MTNRIFYLLSFAFISITIWGCSKSNNDVPSQTHIRFINATPNGSFDIYSNNENILSGLTFDSVSNFASGLPGLYSLEIKNNGESSDLIKGNQQLQSGIYYTTFLIPDTTGGLSSNKVTISTLTENTVTPARDSMRIRFLNLAPYTPPITVLMTIDGRKKTTDSLRPFVNRYFNDQVSNSALSAYYYTFTTSTWKIKFINTKDSLPIIDSVYETFASQGIYTMYLKGTPGGTGEQKLSYKLIKQNLN